MVGHIGHSTVWICGFLKITQAQELILALSGDTEKAIIGPALVFFGQISSVCDPYHMHRGSQPQNPPFSGPNEETLFELFFAVGGLQCGILSGPLLTPSGGTKALQVSAKGRSIARSLSLPLPQSRSPL